MMGSDGYVGGASCGGANNVWGTVCLPGCLRKNGICCSVTKCHLRKREPKKKRKNAHTGNLHARDNRCIHPKTRPDVKGDSFALQQSHRNQEAKNGVEFDTDVQPNGGEEPESTQGNYHPKWAICAIQIPHLWRQLTGKHAGFKYCKVCNLLLSLTEDTANFVLLLNYNTYELWHIIISWRSATAASPSCG